MLPGLLGCAALNLLIVWQKEFFIRFFTTEPEIIRYAAIRMEYVLLFQFIASSYEISGAALRGIGYSMTPTVLTIFGPACCAWYGFSQLSPCRKVMKPYWLSILFPG